MTMKRRTMTHDLPTEYLEYWGSGRYQHFGVIVHWNLEAQWAEWYGSTF